MSSKKREINLIPAILIIVGVIVLVVIGSLYAFNSEPETIQGQADVTEYRVSSKVPARIAQIRVHEGDYVHKGDTLAILSAPEVQAKLQQAQGLASAAQAQNLKADNGARQEQIRGAYDMWQKAQAGVEIAQKLDEATANLKAAIATARAAESQYDMARNGARNEDKAAARAVVSQARGAVNEVRSYIKETYLIASEDGEVTEIFPEQGELVGTGAPIMNVARINDIWVTFNVREDHLADFGLHKKVKMTIPGLKDKAVEGTVFYIKALGSYATWKATKSTGQFDMKTFEVRVRPTQKIEGLRPGMTALYQHQ